MEFLETDKVRQKTYITKDQLIRVQGQPSLEYAISTYLLKNPFRNPYAKKKPNYSHFTPSDTLCFINSIYSNRAPTAFFPYPKSIKTNQPVDNGRLKRYMREDVD
jgi:hypothetical protein